MENNLNLPQADNVSDSDSEIKFSEINWDSLNEEQFHKLSEKMLERYKRDKKSKTNSTKMVTVTIAKKNYSITEGLLNRIKSASNPEAKQKLINDIILSKKPIIEI